MAGSFLLALAKGQKALGHEVMAVAPHAAGLPAEHDVAGVRVRRYRYGPDHAETLAYAGTMHEQVLASWRARIQLLKLLAASRRAVRQAVRDFQPDVIHVHWWFPGGLAVWPGRPAGPALVVTSHGTDLFLLDRFRLSRPIARRVFRSADAVTVISEPLLERVRRLGVDSSRVTVVPMPVDTSAFSANSGDSRQPGLLLFAGRLIERKGPEFAIRALAALRAEGRPVRLVLAGDGPERDRLARLATELGVGKHVALPGTLPAAELGALYRQAQVFLLPAVTDWKGEQEGFGLVLVEAMQSGAPVVATRSGGIPDVVRDGETGLLAPERDAAALAAAVARLLDDPALAARLSRAAQADVRQRFAPERIAQTFDQVYREAVARHRGAVPSGTRPD